MSNEMKVSCLDLLQEFNETRMLYTASIGMSPGETPTLSVFHERHKDAEALMGAFGENYMVLENQLASDISKAVNKFYVGLLTLEE